MKSTNFKGFLLIALLALSSQACQWWPEFGLPASEHKWAEFNPVRDMYDGPAYQDQHPGGMFYPAVHSQPEDFQFDGIAKTERDKAKRLKNPVVVTEESIAYGKQMYETTCIVCHGADAKGHGTVIGKDKFNAKLPDLTTAKYAALSDGEIYHVITHGFGIMFSYKSQLEPIERWSVINYIRTLQRAANPSPQDVAK